MKILNSLRVSFNFFFDSQNVGVKAHKKKILFYKTSGDMIIKNK